VTSVHQISILSVFKYGNCHNGEVYSDTNVWHPNIFKHLRKSNILSLNFQLLDRIFRLASSNPRSNTKSSPSLCVTVPRTYGREEIKNQKDRQPRALSAVAERTRYPLSSVSVMRQSIVWRIYLIRIDNKIPIYAKCNARSKWVMRKINVDMAGRTAGRLHFGKNNFCVMGSSLFRTQFSRLIGRWS